MRLLAILLVLAILYVLIAHAIIPAVRWAAGKVSQRRNEGADWEVFVDPDDNGTTTDVYLRKPGEPNLLVGSVPVTLPYYEFDERLTEIKLEAVDKANSMNRRLPA